MRAGVATLNIVVAELDKKIQFVKQKQLTGVLLIEGGVTHRWRLYFLAGQLVWANTRTHAKRRWCRQILKYRPELLKHGLSAYPADWNYSRLARLVICKKFNRQVFSDIVAGCISEVLFDVQQQGTLLFETTEKGLRYRVKAQKACDFSCINLQNVGLWTQAKRDWQNWEDRKLTQINPNDALFVQDLATLEDLAVPRLFKLLSAVADGRQTLRDIALKTNQSLTSFTTSILPHLDSHGLQLQPVEDKITRAVAATQDNVVVKLAQAIVPKDARIVYVDDSLSDSHKMATIVEAAGYRYTNIADPLEVLKQLVKLKPKMIFLRQSMAVVNGYELCAQIRRMSVFKDTPVVIVGSSNGFTERMRAKIVGASEFVSTPIKPKNVLKTLIELHMI